MAICACASPKYHLGASGEVIIGANATATLNHTIETEWGTATATLDCAFCKLHAG